MNKVYRHQPKNRLKNVNMVNHNTGEVGSLGICITDNTDRRYPMQGHSQVYCTKLENIIELSKNAQKLFFALTHKVDESNIIIGKWKDFIDAPANRISTAKKELIEQGFVAKLGKVMVLNPYVVLPKYQKQNPNSQYEIQRIWTRYLEDANAYYDGIDNDAHILYGV